MLKELKTHHREIARLRFEGLKPSDIASRTETKYQTVAKILRDPMCVAYMNGLSDKADSGIIDVRRSLAEMNISALAVVKDLLDPNIPAPASVKFAAAKDVLDRTGHKPIEQKSTVNVHFTTEDIMEMRARQQELFDKNNEIKLKVIN